MRKTMFIAVLLVFGISCRELENVNPTKSIVTENIFEPSDDIEFNGEYLVFPTPKSFEKTYKSLQNSNPEKVRQWSAKLGFNSVRMIYEKALAEEKKSVNELIATYKSYPAGDSRLNVKPTIVQPDYVQEHADQLVFGEDGMIWRAKLSNYDMTALVNKDGLVKVAGHLFQYNDDNIKIIVGGDPAKISKLASVSETNEKLNIVVNPVRHEYKQSGQKELTESGRIWYTFYGQSEYWDNPWDPGQDYYFKFDIHISIYAYPLFDTTPICEPAGCAEVRTSQPMDCNCYYPIIGYIDFSRFETHMETHEMILSGWVSTSTHCHACTIEVYYAKSGGLMEHIEHTREDYVNTYLTIYDDTPAVEFVCGHHTYLANFDGAFFEDEHFEWCD